MARVKPRLAHIHDDQYAFYPAPSATEAQERMFLAKREALIKATGRPLIREDFDHISTALGDAHGEWEAHAVAPDHVLMGGHLQDTCATSRKLRALLGGSDDWENRFDEDNEDKVLAATAVVERIEVLDAELEMLAAKQRVTGRRRARRWMDLYIEASESDGEEMPPVNWDWSAKSGEQLYSWSVPGEWISNEVMKECCATAERQTSLVSRLVEELRRLEDFADKTESRVGRLPIGSANRRVNSHHMSLWTG